jgi:quercetin dioxygenase-like cupin family protein
MSKSLDKLAKLTDELPDLLSMETPIGGPAVLFADDAGKQHIGFGVYKDADIAIMRTYAQPGSILHSHAHKDEHEWLGIIKGHIRLTFQDNNEVRELRDCEITTIEPGRPHCVVAVEETWAWSATIPPAIGYPSVQSCPFATRIQVRYVKGDT